MCDVSKAKDMKKPALRMLKMGAWLDIEQAQSKGSLLASLEE